MHGFEHENCISPVDWSLWKQVLLNPVRRPSASPTSGLRRNSGTATRSWPVCKRSARDAPKPGTVPAWFVGVPGAGAVLLYLDGRVGWPWIGVLAVEFFLAGDGTLLVNELAPRPHNSGHLTLDAAETSQFEQQLRIAAGLPLGGTALVGPAVMLNLLGEEPTNKFF